MSSGDLGDPELLVVAADDVAAACHRARHRLAAQRTDVDLRVLTGRPRSPETPPREETSRGYP